MKKTLELTEQELNLILFALQKQPFEVVNDLIRDIITQLQRQQTEVKTSASVEVEK